jgi:hypothetical protein
MLIINKIIIIISKNNNNICWNQPVFCWNQPVFCWNLLEWQNRFSKFCWNGTFVIPTKGIYLKLRLSVFYKIIGNSVNLIPTAKKQLNTTLSTNYNFLLERWNEKSKKRQN